MRTADEIRAEIERMERGLRTADTRTQLAIVASYIAALIWVLSDPAPIHADPSATQEPRT